MVSGEFCISSGEYPVGQGPMTERTARGACWYRTGHS